MKKILFAVFALAALASCTNNEVIELNQQAIAFGDVFVDNATRADYSGGRDIQRFKVYGTVEGNSNTVQIFTGADVERPEGLIGYSATAWNCNVTQYWVPDAEYKFAAIVDANSIAYNTEPPLLPETINFTVTDGDGDLLYAEAEAETDENATPDVSMVAFSFKHLLSKVQFKITNSIGAGYSIKVTGISVDGALDKGVYTVAGDGAWEKATDAAKLATPLSFGTTDVLANGVSAVASHTCQILPLEQKQKLDITITYEIYYGGQLLSTNTKAGSVDQTFAKDTVYSINAAITGSRIQFTVSSVAGFTNSGNITLE